MIDQETFPFMGEPELEFSDFFPTHGPADRPKPASESFPNQPELFSRFSDDLKKSVALSSLTKPTKESLKRENPRLATTQIKRVNSSQWEHTFNTYDDACDFIAQTALIWEVLRSGEETSFLLRGYAGVTLTKTVLDREEVGPVQFNGKTQTRVNYTLTTPPVNKSLPYWNGKEKGRRY